MKIKVLSLILLLTIFIITFNQLQASSHRSFFDRLEFDISYGTSGLTTDDFNLRSEAFDHHIALYASQYGITYTSSGNVEKINRLNPFDISIQYALTRQFFFKAGINFGNIRGSGLKTYQENWPDFNVDHMYNISDKISVVMPYLGGGYRAGNFDFYAALGVGTATLSHNEQVGYTEPDYTFQVNRKYDVDGSGLGILLGIKYRVKLVRLSSKHSLAAFVKLEALLLNIGSFSGTKHEVGSNSDGSTTSNTESGSIYTYEFSPYQSGSFSTWDLHSQEPSGIQYASVSKLSMNMSAIRLMLGLSF